MKDTIKQTLQSLKDHLGDSIFDDSKRFKAALADTPIESSGTAIRNLLKIAICDMKAYSQLETAFANKDRFKVDNLAGQMSSDFMIGKTNAYSVIGAIAEFLGYETVAVPMPTPEPNAGGAGKPTTETGKGGVKVDSSIESLMKRGRLFLEDSDWKQADGYFDRVLDIDPEYAPAYIGKLCAELKMRQEALLARNKEPLDTNKHFQKALRFAETGYRVILERYNEEIKKRLLQEHYDKLVRAKSMLFKEKECVDLAEQFRKMNGYKDTTKLADECDNQYCILKKQREKREEQERIEHKQREEQERIEREQREEQKRIEREDTMKMLNIKCKSAIGGIISFGGYDWRVLDIQNNKALILNENVIEKRAYHEKEENVTWKTCALRGYLNGKFLNKFSSNDRSRIADTKVKNNKDPRYGTKGGGNTTDKIFLLSIEEVVKYFGDSGQLKNYCIDDQYNSARIAKDATGSAFWWWLRSPSFIRHYAANVYDDGRVSVIGGTVILVSVGVRPALRLNL